MPLSHSTPVLLVSALALLAACGGGELEVPGTTSSSTGGGGTGGDGGAGGAGGGEPSDTWPNLACDPIQGFCGFPFPSNVYTVPDAATATGRRVSFLPDMLPTTAAGYKPSGEPWSKADGFSASTALLAHFPGATDTGLADAFHIADSLNVDSKTVLLDTVTGERVAHWAELDKSTTDVTQRSLMIRPAAPLVDGRRYVVAVRGLVDAQGQPITPTPAFAALRDGGESSEPSVVARRGLYDEIFSLLLTTGVAREDVLLAWDFTTASKESNTGWLLHMRDAALAAVGADGPEYTITNVQTDFDPAIAFRIEGTFKAPLFLDQPGPGAKLLFGADGKPRISTDTPTYDVPFLLMIPTSASSTTPAKLLQYGHGLLGSRTQIGAGHFRSFMDNFGYAMFAVDLVGMASDDEDWVAEKVALGQADQVTAMFDRMHQGFVNYVVAMRLMSAGMANDATYGPLLDASDPTYFGISQGGIAGGVYVTISTEIERGALEVMGQPYNLLLNRSVDFDPFFALMKNPASGLPDARQQQLFLGALQMGWDRVEPSGYTKYTTTGIDAAAGPKRVLMRAALGDHQVTTIGAHQMARAMGAKHVDTGLRDIYALEKVTGPVTTGAAYLEYDFGLPEDPVCNVPQALCDDPHGKLRSLDAAREQLDRFLTTGEILDTCENGVCDYSALSGCAGGETQVSCQ